MVLQNSEQRLQCGAVLDTGCFWVVFYFEDEDKEKSEGTRTLSVLGISEFFQKGFY